MTGTVELRRAVVSLRRRGVQAFLAASFLIGLLYGVLLIGQDNSFAEEMTVLSGIQSNAGEPGWLLF